MLICDISGSKLDRATLANIIGAGTVLSYAAYWLYTAVKVGIHTMLCRRYRTMK